MAGPIISTCFFFFFSDLASDTFSPFGPGGSAQFLRRQTQEDLCTSALSQPGTLSTLTPPNLEASISLDAVKKTHNVIRVMHVHAPFVAREKSRPAAVLCPIGKNRYCI